MLSFSDWMLLVFAIPSLAGLLIRYRMTGDVRSVGIGLILVGLSYLVLATMRGHS